MKYSMLSRRASSKGSVKAASKTKGIMSDTLNSFSLRVIVLISANGAITGNMYYHSQNVFLNFQISSRFSPPPINYGQVSVSKVATGTSHLKLKKVISQPKKRILS